MVEVSLVISVAVFIIFVVLFFKLAQSLFKIAVLALLLILSGIFLVFFTFNDASTTFSDALLYEEGIVLLRDQQDQNRFVAGFSLASPDEQFTEEMLLAYEDTLPENQTILFLEQMLFDELSNNPETLSSVFTSPTFFEQVGNGEIVIHPEPGFIVNNLHRVPDFVFDFLTVRNDNSVSSADVVE